MKTKRKLGKVQADILRCLVEYGSYTECYGGWVWETPSRTKRILRSLEIRGLVKHPENDWATREGIPKNVRVFSEPLDECWVPTTEGINWLRNQRCSN